MSKNGNVVERDLIYAGKLINIKEIAGTISERKEELNSEIVPSINGEKQLFATYIYDYRSIMFMPDEKKLAIDLLYKSNSYPVLNMSKKDTCMASDILITDAVYLGPILKELGYGELMSLEEVKEIRSILFSTDFVSKNCHMFGYEKLSSNQAKQPRKMFELRVAVGNHKYRFNPFIEDALPGQYMHFIEQLNNNTIKEALDRMTFTSTFKKDAFKPTLEEMKTTKKIIKKRRNYNDI